MFDRVMVKERARTILRQDRWPSVGVLVLYGILVYVLSAATFGVGLLLLAPPLVVGLSMYFNAVWRKDQPSFGLLFGGFNSYTKSLASILWMQLWTFLWSLLFVIPGIVKAIAYSMTPYLMADHPDMDPRHALKVSMAMTQGRKGEIFMTYLSFLGWEILAGLTLGILEIVFVGPYRQITFAGLYDELLKDAYARGIVTDADFAGY